MLEQITRELNIEALPNAIPESISHDVSRDGHQRHVTLGRVTAPAGVTLLDDLEETIAHALPAAPRGRGRPEIEEETERVGEDPPAAATPAATIADALRRPVGRRRVRPAEPAT